MTFRRHSVTLCALVPLASGLAGCGAFHPPQPWEKGLLAKPAMTMGGDAQERRFDQHIAVSKEAASGGAGVGGGGCGCN
jgi:Domain of unknown function (DUF4266)